ncbi:hypothetical protein EYF80_011098 [Liparis tanakae]|uniref:Uncharacterized protein n=1 Tax=Liparis tanakae TaxID=230148 RepID=A0A4Z2IMI7_9TELE|nr:hypothetical protein EYF80_011098 [Liparis tanakae]
MSSSSSVILWPFRWRFRTWMVRVPVELREGGPLSTTRIGRKYTFCSWRLKPDRWLDHYFNNIVRLDCKYLRVPGLEPGAAAFTRRSEADSAAVDGQDEGGETDAFSFSVASSHIEASYGVASSGGLSFTSRIRILTAEWDAMGDKSYTDERDDANHRSYFGILLHLHDSALCWLKDGRLVYVRHADANDGLVSEGTQVDEARVDVLIHRLHDNILMSVFSPMSASVAMMRPTGVPTAAPSDTENWYISGIWRRWPKVGIALAD